MTSSGLPRRVPKADRPDTLLAWDAAGGALCVENAGPWLAYLPDAPWDMVPPIRRATAALDWHPEHGDCCQHLAFTSPGLDRDGLAQLLESFLLTDDEYAAGPEAWKHLPPRSTPPRPRLVALASDTKPKSEPTKEHSWPGPPSRPPQAAQVPPQPPRRRRYHVHRLQGHRPATEVHLRPREDPQPPRHSRHRPAAAADRRSDQERPGDGAPAVRPRVRGRSKPETLRGRAVLPQSEGPGRRPGTAFTPGRGRRAR